MHFDSLEISNNLFCFERNFPDMSRHQLHIQRTELRHFFIKLSSNICTEIWLKYTNFTSALQFFVYEKQTHHAVHELRSVLPMTCHLLH